MQLRQLTYGAVAALAISGAAVTPAFAAVINFDQSEGSSPTGTVVYDGNGGALNGSEISFDRVSLNNGTGVVPNGNPSTINCESCALNFTTGDNLEEGNDGTFTFANGGSLSLDGTLTDGNGQTIATGNLVQGTFTNSEEGSPQIVLQTGPDGLNVSTNGNTDNLNSDLLSFFGIDSQSSFVFSNTEISLGDTSFADNGGFTGDVTNADLDVTGTPPSVPEPQELGMFALGVLLLAGGLFARRRRSNDLV